LRKKELVFVAIVDSFALGDRMAVSRKNDTPSHYYYTRLTSRQKRLYDELAAGMRGFAKNIPLPARPSKEIGLVYEYIGYDNPDIYYTTGIKYRSDLSGARCVVRPVYKYKRSFVKEKTGAVQAFLHSFDAAIAKSDYEKALFVHDYCLDNFKYDHAAGEYSNSILGCILNGSAVCEGIAKFAKLAFDHLGVESLFVPGKATDPADAQSVENHAWNMVNIEGRYYHLDITFDMTLSEKTKRYDYFCLSDEDIRKDLKKRRILWGRPRKNPLAYQRGGLMPAPLCG
jgi:hypothetical protein